MGDELVQAPVNTCTCLMISYSVGRVTMSRGGSRYGAGRPGWHVKAEHCRRIDARRWAREGMLHAGRAGGWGWNDSETGELVASIGYAVSTHSLKLDYKMDQTPMSQHVPLLTTPCHYGGTRHWFGCPSCGKRVANLFLRHRGFACRKCNRIVYASQSEDGLGRLWRMQAKLEARLEENWQRPKGMHQSTYDLLSDRIFDCEERRDAGLVVLLGRLGWSG